MPAISPAQPDQPPIFVAPRFQQGMQGLGPAQTKLAYGALYDLRNRCVAEPETVVQRYDHVRHLDNRVLEVDVSAADRLLAQWKGGVLTLLAVGDHDIVARYRPEWLAADVRSAKPAPRGFWPDYEPMLRFFGSMPDRAFEVFGNELDPEWIYYLTDRQRGVLRPMLTALKKANLEGPKLFFLLGGPGTGKTALLLKLLLELSAGGANPGLVMSEALAQYVERGAGIRLGDCLVSPDVLETAASLGSPVDDPFDILLVDDPGKVNVIEYALDSAVGSRRAVIIGFDPCQLDPFEDFDDAVFAQLAGSYEVKPYTLRECYRQKETLGRAAKRVMDRVAASTAYKWDVRIKEDQERHELVYRIANDLTFPNKRGYEETYPKGRLKDAERELDRIRKAPLWQHAPPLLLVLDHRCDAADWPWDELTHGVETVEAHLYPRDYDDLLMVKGLEFQHVIIAVNAALYEQLEAGFESSGKAEYQRRRLLRIPFSRAKDSLVTIVRPEVARS